MNATGYYAKEFAQELHFYALTPKKFTRDPICFLL